VNKPCPTFAVAQSARDVVVFPRIRRRKPTENILLQLVTCRTISVIPASNDNDGITDASACSSRSLHDGGFLALSQTRNSLVVANNVPRASWTSPAEALPSRGKGIQRTADYKWSQVAHRP
jgi:hypothetical protein